MTTSNKPTVDEIKQQLAAIEHERWADWQTWCHQVLRENCPSAELEKVIQRWDKQIATSYPLLTAAEKHSDLEQVDRYWPVVEQLIARECAKHLNAIHKVAVDNDVAGPVKWEIEDRISELQQEAK